MKHDLLLIAGMVLLGSIALLMLIIPVLKSNFGHKKLLAGSTIIVMSVCASMLYTHWGAYEPWTDKRAIDTITSTLETLHQTPQLNQQKILTALHQCEEKITYSHVALARLGNIYTELGLLENARAVWDKIIALQPDNKTYWLPWLYSHTITNEGKLPPHVRQRAERWAQSESPERAVLNILAMDDYFQGHYDRAIQAWTLLLAMDKNLPKERQQVLQNAIAMALSKKRT